MTTTKEGPIFEPRAFWDVAKVTPTRVERPSFTVMSRENFRNGTRNPVVLDRMLLAPVGYTFNDFPGLRTPPVAVGDIDACAAVLERCKVLVTAPDRFGWSWRTNLIAGLCEEQVHDQTMRVDPLRPYSAGLLNTLRWDFPEEHAMILPRGGALGIDLGLVLLQPGGLQADEVENAYATIAWHEEYGIVGGDARTKRVPLRWSNLAPPMFPFFAADGLGFNQPGQTGQLYPPESSFTSKDWRQQQQTQAGSTKVTGFSIAIDQIAWEDAIQDIAPPPPFAPFAGQPLASLALRLPVRMAGTTDGGSKMEWWRPNAPLALVMPSMTPAKVFRLMQPITLNPGDCLEVELETPGGFQALPSDPPIFPTYQIGVSFTGYARIEG